MSALSESAQSFSSRAESFESYFSYVVSVFEKAAALSGDVRRFYQVGPDTLCLRLAGGAIAPQLAPAMAHIEIEPCNNPSLTIYCWDSKSTATAMSSPPWQMEYGPKGHIVGYNDASMRMLYQPGVDILNMLSMKRREGIYWVEHPKVLPYWESSFPMRNILHWWFSSRPFQLVHAGAVGNKKGGVLLTGKSGSGKSTTALACLAGGLEYAGDDYVLARIDEPYVYNLYNTAKLVPEGLDLLPHMREKISNPQALHNEKALMFLYPEFSSKLGNGFPLRAILLPRVTQGQRTGMRPAMRKEVLLALAPTTLKHLEGDGDITMTKLRKLAESLPGYWLELGANMEQIPRVVGDFLDKGCG